MKKVVKFGGSSLASAEQFKKVGNIIRAEESRRYVIPSAPGKRFSDDVKVTDMLYKCYGAAVKGKKFTDLLKDIQERYNEIIEGLGLTLSLEKEFEIIRDNFAKKAGRDYAASRGEYLNGIIMANYLGYEFIDAAEVIFFDEEGKFDADKTDEILSERLNKAETCSNSRILWFFTGRDNQNILKGWFGRDRFDCCESGKSRSLRELDRCVRFSDCRSENYLESEVYRSNYI